MGCDELVLGIDEAGRGPLIGPMIVAGVVTRKCMLSKLIEAGVRDSKQMSRGEREKVYQSVFKVADYIIVVEVPPRLIDDENLNVIERNTIAYIVVRAIDHFGSRLEAVYIDAVGDPASLRRLVEKVGFRGEIIVEHEADARYPIVSAASIVAKVHRDRAIEELRRLYGVRGSGYPSDPETIEWIIEAYQRSPHQPPEFVRTSWATLKRIAPGWYRRKRSKGQKTLLDYMGRRPAC